MKKYTLPKEFGEKWIAALRSTPDSKRIKKDYTNFNGCYCGFGLGMKAMDIKFNEQYIESELPYGMSSLEFEITKLNDDLDYSFSSQADWIEENVELC